MSVMVLLVMVAMGMMSLSKSQVRSSKNDDLKMEARANARMGLLVALGELQKAAGSDLRVTAPASIREQSVAQPHLIGVWKSRQAPNDDNGTVSYESQKRDDFVQWLSSSANQEHLDYQYPVKVPQNAVTLVGNGSLSEPESNDPMNQYVSAAKVHIDEGEERSGSFAWHVFDESLKANLTLKDLDVDGDVDRVAAISGTGMPDFATLSTSYSDYSPLVTITEEEQEKMHSFGSSGLLGAGGTFQPKDANAFHNLTVDSRSLFVDVVNGGYQKDLSLLFEHDNLPNEYASRHLYSESDTPLVSAPTRFAGAEPIPSPDPKWSLLHSHYKMYEKVGSSSGGFSIEVSDRKREGGGGFFEEQQLLPVISNAQFIFALTAADAGSANYLTLTIDPVITLWNPYTVDLRIPDMEIELYRFPLEIKFIKNGINQAPGDGFAHIANMFLVNNMGGVWGNQDTLPYRLRIKPSIGNEIVMKPGEYKVFSPTSFNRHHQLGHYMKGVVLQEGWNKDGGGITTRFLQAPDDGNWSGKWAPWITLQPTDDISLEVRSRKVVRAGTGKAETNGEEIAAYLKVYQGDGGTGYSHTDPNVIAKIDAKRTQVGALELDMSDNELNLKLPYISRNELPTMRPTVTTHGQPYLGKQPFLVASLRLKTELDSSSVAGSPNASLWLHNGITNPYFTAGMDQLGDRHASAFQYEMTWEPLLSWNQIPTVEIDNQNRGYGGSGVSSQTGVNVAPFSHIPLTSSTSMAQLVHAPLNSGGQAPLTTQIVANSFSSPLIPLASKSTSGSLGTHLDHSYLANVSLFDSFFLSTAASEGGPIASASGRSLGQVLDDFFSKTKTLRNPKIVAEEGVAPSITEQDYDTFAQHLYNKGGFNVNSTSVEAWALFLASGIDAALPILNLFNPASGLGSSGQSSGTAVSRFAPLLGEAISSGEDGESRWAGHRRLDERQIIQLAEHVVEQVQKRGPFQSISEFVNRQLSSDTELSNAGALQTAIDESRLNNDFGESAPENATEMGAGGGSANTSDGAATQITQADLLTRIAPSIVVRGDTFKIRAYGEATDGKNTARAWCEAVVQRGHDFMDSSQESTTLTRSLNQVNQELGRRFTVVSFRWLTESEL